MAYQFEEDETRSSDPSRLQKHVVVWSGMRGGDGFVGTPQAYTPEKKAGVTAVGRSPLKETSPQGHPSTFYLTSLHWIATMCTYEEDGRRCVLMKKKTVIDGARWAA